VPRVACPSIVDEQSHLSYRCIDNYLTQGAPDGLLGIRISMNHEVEPDWIISEGSGNPLSFGTPPPANSIDFRAESAASVVAAPRSSPTGAAPSRTEVIAEVHSRTDRALSAAYGANPSARTLAERAITVSGVAAHELLTEVTINDAFRRAQHVNAKHERLWVVGVPTAAGVSVFMMSIPDARSDLWPKAEATVATIRVV
jgi:hypothetical protein